MLIVYHYQGQTLIPLGNRASQACTHCQLLPPTNCRMAVIRHVPIAFFLVAGSTKNLQIIELKRQFRKQFPWLYMIHIRFPFVSRQKSTTHAAIAVYLMNMALQLPPFRTAKKIICSFSSNLLSNLICRHAVELVQRINLRCPHPQLGNLVFLFHFPIGQTRGTRLP